MREKRFSYPKSPRVGYKKPKTLSGKIKGKIPRIVYNISELERAGKDKYFIIIIGKVGARKKLEIIKKAAEMKFEILNVRGGIK